MNNETKTLKIDYSLLMDLRIDYAFKILFTKGETRLLISLLNAIFANKKICRVIKSLKIVNPFLDKESGDDKLSILDIRAELEDGTTVLIEMHLYGFGEFKAKTIRSWARAFGEDLEVGGSYADQPPTIAIAFTDGAVKPVEENETSKKDKIHRLCKIMDCEDYTVFTNAMELHYIDMKAFAKAVNEANSISIDDTQETMFAKWLSVITQKEINNKAIIENACSEEEIFMAVSALSRQSEDKIIRQAYQRRQDEIFYFNKSMAERDEYKQRAEQE
ncbi:MAG: Rpn family recombination-promoting nuclease/putative transposase, partial [Defluviitaleaceae bacterium]|nr:Rpn family recombination-promoting nuclease/putative transposase [Defluviitaleaceae bacterium]